VTSSYIFDESVFTASRRACVAIAGLRMSNTLENSFVTLSRCINVSEKSSPPLRKGGRGRLTLRSASLRFKDANCGRGMCRQLRSGANGTRRQVASAIRAASAQPVVHAIPAERALEGTDHRVRSRGWQFLVTAFAIGA